MMFRNLKFKAISRWVGVILLFAFIAFLSSSLEKQSEDAPISGVAKVVDGDSLRIAGNKIRILNIDAPELFQTCKDKNKQIWNCGKAAKNRMQELVLNEQVICKPNGYDRYSRVLATCYVNKKDVAAILVKEGLAISYGGYDIEHYSAKLRKVGMWAGEFISPREWRNRN